MGNQNPGIRIPPPNACDIAVRHAIQDIVRRLGTTSTPTFAEMILDDLTLTTPVKIYALSHDSWAGFVADEHVAHSGVSVVAGADMTGGGTIDGNVTLNVDPASASDWDAAYAHVSSNGTDHGYIDQDVTTAGSPSFSGLTLTGQADTRDIYPSTDDTYYLGKNDDDTPFAWKGVILKDTTDGKYYRVEVISGVVTATDLTD